MRITIHYGYFSKRFGITLNLRGLLFPIKIYLSEKESLPPHSLPYLHGDHEVAKLKSGQTKEFVIPEKFKYLYGCQSAAKTKYLTISKLSDGDHIEMIDYYDVNSLSSRVVGWGLHDSFTSLKTQLIIASKN